MPSIAWWVRLEDSLVILWRIYLHGINFFNSVFPLDPFLFYGKAIHVKLATFDANPLWVLGWDWVLFIDGGIDLNELPSLFLGVLFLFNLVLLNHNRVNAVVSDWRQRMQRFFLLKALLLPLLLVVSHVLSFVFLVVVDHVRLGLYTCYYVHIQRLMRMALLRRQNLLPRHQWSRSSQMLGVLDCLRTVSNYINSMLFNIFRILLKVNKLSVVHAWVFIADVSGVTHCGSELFI